MRPIRSTAMPRHGISMMALVPRPPRHRSSLRRPPFPRRTQERACSSAPAPGSDQWTDHSFHAWRICVALPHAPPLLLARGLRGKSHRVALHVMWRQPSTRPTPVAHAPPSSRLVSSRHRLPWANKKMAQSGRPFPAAVTSTPTFPRSEP